MGKDFRVGLMTGVVLAGAALIWVATRPSLSPQARVGATHASSVREAGHASSALETAQPARPPLPWETIEGAEGNGSQIGSGVSGQTRDAPQQTHSIAPAPVPSHPAPTTSNPGSTPSTVGAGSVLPPPPDLTIHETTEPIKTTRFHIVRKGESLSSIAAQYLGSSTKWRKIVEANQKIIKDPNKIAPGTKLIIPD